MAVSGRATTTVARGNLSLTSNRLARLGRWRWHLPILRSSTPAVEKACDVPTSAWGTEFINPRMAVSSGNTWDCGTLSKLAPFWLTRTMRSGFSRRCWVIPMDPMQNVESSARSMAERIGKRSSTKTKTPARSISLSIPATHKLFMLFFGRRVVHPGQPATPTMVRVAGCTNQPTAATIGVNSLGGCPPGRMDWGALDWLLHRMIPNACTPWWMRLSWVGSIVPKMRANTGRE